MAYRYGAGLASATTDNEAQKIVGTGGRDAQSLRATNLKKQQTIRAEVIGSNACMALGIMARGHAPVFALCRRLIETGHDADRPLVVWRGEMLALRVRSIGIGARFTISEDRLGRPKLRRLRTAGSDVGAAPIARNRQVRK